MWPEGWLARVMRSGVVAVQGRHVRLLCPTTSQTTAVTEAQQAARC